MPFNQHLYAQEGRFVVLVLSQSVYAGITQHCLSAEVLFQTGMAVLPACSNLRGQERKPFVVVPLDGAFRRKNLSPSVQAVKQFIGSSNGAL